MKVLIFLSFLILISACNNDGPVNSDNGIVLIEKDIIQNTKEQTFESLGEIKVIIPDSAVNKTVKLKIVKLPKAPLNMGSQIIMGSNIFKITVIGDFILLKPIEFRIKYDLNKIQSGKNANSIVRGLVYINNNWSQIDYIIDEDKKELVFYMIPGDPNLSKNHESLQGDPEAIIGDGYKVSDQLLGDEIVTIGTQVWMKKNLDVAYYRNGDPIPQVTDNAQWVSSKTGAWCYYNNDPAMGAIYGKMYNAHAVMDSRGLAPIGWHVPNTEEVDALANYLGGYDVAGGKLKESNTKHWHNPNIGGTNSSGFTALPGGYRSYGGAFFAKTFMSVWWTSDPVTIYNTQYYYLNDSLQSLGSLYGVRWGGFSVRCIKD